MIRRPFDWQRDCPQDVDDSLEAAWQQFELALAAKRAADMTDDDIRKGLRLDG